MNQFSEHSYEPDSTDRDPLPMGVDLESSRIDRSIARMATRDLRAVPSDMSERVFRASAGMLPQRQTTAVTAERLPLNFNSFRMLLAHMNVGRVAMAAMVLLAFGIGALMMHTSGVKSLGDSMLAHGGERADRARPSAAGINPSTHVADWEIAAVTMNAAPGSVDEMNDKVSYLLEADTLTTPEEVRSDMVQLLASLQ